MNLTHLNHNNNPTMVDVSTKDNTSREALASGKITMSKAAFLAVIENTNKKGPVIQTAVIAAIMATKNTSQIIPMCHPLFISKVNVDIIPLEEECAFRVESLVLKAIDKSMVISDICLESKSGGKSGDYKRA